MPDGGRLVKPLPAAKRMGRPWLCGWGLFALSLLRVSFGLTKAKPNYSVPAAEAHMKPMLRMTLATAMLLAWHPALAADGDPGRGQRVFSACAPCHSLEPGKNMTGPSLAELWKRQAGTLPGFDRYSPALKGSGIIWEDA